MQIRSSSAPAAAAALVIVAGLAGCTKASGGKTATSTSPTAGLTSAAASAPSTPIPTATPTATPDDAKAAVRNGYLAYWIELVGKAGRRPDPKDKRIAQYTTGDALKKTRSIWATRKAGGRGTYGQVVPHIRSIKVQGNTATVIDCLDSSKSGLARISDGHKLTVGVPRHLITTRLVEGPTGTWKVARITHVQGSEC